MNNYRVVFKEKAIKQLCNIKSYIKETLLNPKAATDFGNNVEDHVKILEIEPHKLAKSRVQVVLGDGIPAA